MNRDERALPPRLDSLRASGSGYKLSLLLLLCAGALAGAGAAVLFLFDPATHGFYPFCVMYRLTGWQCPGCGSLRALHQLTHGHVLEALRLNPLVTLTAPLWVWLMVRNLLPFLGREVKPLNIETRWVVAALVVVVLYGIIRNLV